MSLFAGPSRPTTASTAVTYRHLHSSQAMTPFNPLRTIAHCDIDGAFAQFEQVRLGLPDTVPLICSQWGSIIAVNYPARAYGIKRMHNAVEAKKLCPSLVVQHVATYRDGDTEAGYWDDVDRRTHKVSLDPYRRESLKILAVFREMVPRGELEKASIDEAFMDLTPMVVERLLELHPYLATVPEDAPDGLDSPLPDAPPIDWTKAGHIVPVVDGSFEEERPAAAGDGEVEDTATWADWALCVGAEIMADVRAEVWKRLHYTCSAGIAHNKALAKICSGWKKPNQQTVLRMSATPGFMRDMDFTDIRFLGGKLGNAIAEEYSAKTVGDMLPITLEDMQAKFGEESIWVYNILRGIDYTEVKEKLSTKSMLASKNTIPNVTTHAQGHHWLAVLAGELCVRLREARTVAPGLWPKTIVLSTRVGWDSRSRQLPFPFARDLDAAYIVKQARRLWDEHCGQLKDGQMKLNNISLSFTGLEKLEDGQRGIEGFFKAKRPRDEPTQQARDSSASAGPSSSVSESAPKRARLPTLHTGPKPQTGLESFLSKGKSASQAAASRSVRASLKVEAHGSEEEMPADETASASASWTCPRCRETITPPESVDVDVDVEEGEGWVARQRAEHEDWHFAVDLQAQYGSVEGNGSGSSGGSRGGTPVSSTTRAGNGAGRVSVSQKKKKKPEGIKAFFATKK